MNEEKIRPESVYVSLIEECRKEVDVIRCKVSFITRPQQEETVAETPNRTELEGELKSLLAKIRELQKDIVV